jgi:hypothetical protein
MVVKQRNHRRPVWSTCNSGVAENLFNEAETYADPKAVEPEVFEQPLKKTRAGYKRKSFFEICLLRKCSIRSTLTSGCPACGGRLRMSGKKFVRSEINFVPAQLSVLNIIPRNMRMSACKVRTGKTAFIEPKVPAPVLPHSYASASSIAYTMYQKYVQSVPLTDRRKTGRQWANLTKRHNPTGSCSHLSHGCHQLLINEQAAFD